MDPAVPPNAPPRGISIAQLASLKKNAASLKKTASVAPENFAQQTYREKRYAFTKPVLTGVPRLTEHDRGIQWLEHFDGLFVAQNVESLDVGLQQVTSNAYTLAPILPDAEVPQELTTAYAYTLRAAMESVKGLKGHETGTCFHRVCCPLTRAFDMRFVDSDGTLFFSVERPHVLEPCTCWPFLFSRSQYLSLLDREGKIVVNAFEPVGFFKACWTRTFVAMDVDGTPLYTLRASDCGTQNGCNFCAPTCVNESYEVDVFSPEGEYINSSAFVWPGCSCGAADRTNLLLRFPQHADATQRAGIFAGLMLVDYTVLEILRLREGNSSSSAPLTKTSAGAPTVAEMDR